MQKKLIALLVCVVITSSSYAQGKLFENWAVGLNAGLYGYGIQGATSLSPNIKARAGFDFISYTHNDAIDFEFNAIKNGLSLNHTIIGAFYDTKLKFTNAKVMIDYYPMKTGILCFTAGVYLGKNNVYFNGQIDDYEQYADMPNMGDENIIIQPNRDGSFNATFKLKNSVKPYLGLGLGRTIPKSRIGFKFELGVVYQGDWKMESDNVANNNYSVNDFLNLMDDFPISEKTLKLWPMLNFTLSYKIK